MAENGSSMISTGGWGARLRKQLMIWQRNCFREATRKQVLEGHFSRNSENPAVLAFSTKGPVALARSGLCRISQPQMLFHLFVSHLC